MLPTGKVRIRGEGPPVLRGFGQRTPLAQGPPAGDVSHWPHGA
jgi:hypothetical protein